MPRQWFLIQDRASERIPTNFPRNLSDSQTFMNLQFVSKYRFLNKTITNVYSPSRQKLFIPLISLGIHYIKQTSRERYSSLQVKRSAPSFEVERA